MSGSVGGLCAKCCLTGVCSLLSALLKAAELERARSMSSLRRKCGRPGRQRLCFRGCKHVWGILRECSAALAGMLNAALAVLSSFFASAALRCARHARSQHAPPLCVQLMLSKPLGYIAEGVTCFQKRKGLCGMPRRATCVCERRACSAPCGVRSGAVHWAVRGPHCAVLCIGCRYGACACRCRRGRAGGNCRARLRRCCSRGRRNGLRNAVSPFWGCGTRVCPGRKKEFYGCRGLIARVRSLAENSRGVGAYGSRAVERAVRHHKVDVVAVVHGIGLRCWLLLCGLRDACGNVLGCCCVGCGEACGKMLRDGVWA